jgi:nucleotide-binding universal stress UspA family protein
MNEIMSFNPKHILCPVDFSDLSNLALKYAAAGARVYGSKLTVLHAERFELPRYFSRSETDRLAHELTGAKAAIEKELAEHVAKILGQETKTLGIEFEVAEAHPVDAVLHTADKKSTGLIVLGTHGLGGVKRLLLGSVAENLIRAAKAPVFTVRQKEHEFIDVSRVDTAPRLKRILCPCEVNELGRITLSHAVSLAERFQARLTVLYSDESQKADDLSQVRETLCDWISRTVTTSCDLEPIVRKGNAADQIITSAKEEKDDLIVIGARHRIFHDAMVLGKTTDLVVRHASVPVLIIPGFSDS